MTPEEFRAAGHTLIDWIADHRERIPGRPVNATVEPGQVRGRLPEEPPSGTDTIDDLIADLEAVVVPGLTQIQHPRYAGWFPANASLASVLGDLASGGLGALGISWQSAPALTEVEEVVCDWLRRLTGLDEQWQGAIHDTASTACLIALLAARERLVDPESGLQASDRPLVVYASEQAHSSVAKGAILAGYGRANIRLIPTDPVTFAMRADELRSALEQDRAAGRRPAAVVASIGTTATTAIDPLAQIVAVALDHDVWLHVDAAMAGSALLLPEYRWMAAGIEGADSLSWNPHKWMGTILDCSLLYVRDPGALVDTMSTAPSYLRSTAAGVTEYRDWGIPLGRRFRALKLWFHLRLDGVEAIRARLRRDLANAQWLAEQVAAAPGWEVVAPVNLQTVCVRRTADTDDETLAWADAVNGSGEAFVTPARLNGRWMVRISLGSEPMERPDVEAIWRAARRFAEV
jgi:aromatic-L-amino-acid/L-tryptophan decarboxylase